MYSEQGEFVENFTYDKWQEMVKAGHLTGANVLVPEENKTENENAEEAKE